MSGDPAWRIARTISGWVLVSMAIGAAAGLLWSVLAPQVIFTVTDSGAVAEPGSSAVPFDADLMLGLLLTLSGVLVAVVWWRRGAARPAANVTGMVIGGLLGGLCAVLLGQWLSAGPDAEMLAVGTEYASGLELRSTAMLAWWPGAVVIVWALSSLRWANAPGRSQEDSPAIG